jgi:hypothetical protein
MVRLSPPRAAPILWQTLSHVRDTAGQDALSDPLQEHSGAFVLLT